VAGSCSVPACPWGDEEPSTETGATDWRSIDPVDVGACEAGESPVGCRQMIGSVWKWTATDFAAYPNFSWTPISRTPSSSSAAGKCCAAAPWRHAATTFTRSCATTSPPIGGDHAVGSAHRATAAAVRLLRPALGRRVGGPARVLLDNFTLESCTRSMGLLVESDIFTIIL
jgi:formylglycine-generating enzyme required for sulfatase activity